MSSALNLGCGRKRIDGAVNVDRAAIVKPDVVHDLDLLPWPFEENQFGEIHAYDVIEHCADLVATMNEIHRISANGAVLHVTTPHFSSANSYIDPTHKHHLSYFSFDYFTGDDEFGFYTDRRFRKRRAQIVFYPSMANKLIWRIANRFPRAYERRWAWLFPAWFLSVDLEVIK
jgi:SAM-dependent methyltransferase